MLEIRSRESGETRKRKKRREDPHPNPLPEGEGVRKFEDELADACISEAEWDDYEDIMRTGTEEEKENYQCWMTHWIEDCDKCTCTGESGCPDDDPFD